MKLLLLELFEQYHSIVPTEAEVAAHRAVDVHLPLLIRYVVQIALGIRSLVVDCRRHNAVLYRPRGDHRLEASRGAQGVARDALRARHAEPIALRVVAQHRLQPHRLELVVVRRARAVGVDVVDVGLVHAGLLDGHLHRGREASSLRCRGRYVVRVARGAVPDHLAVDRRAAREGAVERLEDDDAGSLTHDEASPVGIERPTPCLGVVVVVSVHGLHAAEARVGERGDGRLGPPGDHLVGGAVLDHAEGLADGVGRRGARGGDAVVGSPAAALDPDHARGCVSQKRRDCERRNLRPLRLLPQLQRLPLKRFHASKCAADHDANLVWILERLRRVPELGVLQRQPARRHGEVSEPVVALGVLRVGEVILRVEHRIGDLATDLARVVRDVEARYAVEARDPVDDVVEEGLVADAAAGDDAEARDDNALLLRREGRGADRRRRRRPSARG
mmetsp:Transcript_4614/g.9685  ORF Transcript_4614/g.9685 Transcript_4614/m.9685 type:complete len:447 (+) Transcript_4614:137-1477(+)